MPQGIEVRNAAGELVFDTGSRLFRILTTSLAGSGGSYTDPALNGNFVSPAVQQTNPDLYPPTFTVSGNTVTWGFGSAPTPQRDTGALIQILVY